MYMKSFVVTQTKGRDRDRIVVRFTFKYRLP